MSISTEQEQIQAIKQWLQTNGLQIVLAAVIVGGGYFGWKGWESYREARVDRASDLYAEFIRTTDPIEAGAIISSQVIATATSIADELLADYDDSLYSVLADAELARLHVLQGELDVAEQRLRGALGRTDDGGMQHILRLRLSEVLQSRGALDQALAELGEPDPSFAGLFARQRGSILQQSGRNDEAVAAYREAVAALELDHPDIASLLRLQIQQLGGSVPVTEATSEEMN